MFARVITAGAQAKGFNGFMRLARQQLPGPASSQDSRLLRAHRRRDGQAHGHLAVGDPRADGGSRSQGRAPGIREEGIPATGLTSLNLETCEVAPQA